MRLGVLDIGSNTGHLLVVDAHDGAAPIPAYSHKEPLRLSEHLDEHGAVSKQGVHAMVRFIAEALEAARDKGCEEILGFATSAVRDAVNTDDVLRQVHDETGVDMTVLPGDDEARLTFLAVRRWFGWSSGHLAVFDVGGGSLEIAVGADEAPDVVRSLPLGAGRLTRDWLRTERPSQATVRELQRKVRADIARDAGTALHGTAPDHAVATSKTLRSLARVCGAAPSAEGVRVRRILPADTLAGIIPKLARLTYAETAALPGVSARRAHQLLAGAVVADAVMDLFELRELEVCPWALREGVILERLDQISILGNTLKL